MTARKSDSAPPPAAPGPRAAPRSALDPGPAAADRSEEPFRLLVESVRDYAIFLLDREGRVSSWNLGAERIKGYASEEILGQHFSRFYPPEDLTAGKPARELEVAAREGRIEDEGWRLRKDGSRFWANVVITALRDETGRLVGFAKVTRDLTERKRAEEERARLVAEQAAARRVAFLAEAGTVLGSSLDYDATLASTARLAIPELGDWCVIDLLEGERIVRAVAVAHVEPAKEARLRELPHFPPDPEGPHPVARALRGGQPELVTVEDEGALAALVRVPEQLQILRDVGAASLIVVPLMARGRRLGAISFGLAGTSRRYGAADLTLASELARRAAQAIDNARLYHEAQEAVRIREEFLSVASHELRTPLTPLQLHVQRLLTLAHAHALASLPHEQLLRGLATADRQVRRFAALIEAMLDSTRLAAGRLELELERLDLSEIVRGVAERFADDLARAGSVLTVRAEAPVIGRWDRLRLDQVVTNLVSNAIKYGAGAPIEIRVEAEESYACLTVRDQGLGIDPQAQRRIFEPFQRAVSARRFGGLGLGLYIAHQLVAAHEGTVRVASAPGQGSTFTVELPLAGPAAVNASAEAILGRTNR